MNLKGTKLVVLSTCNSAIGELPVNEAVNSLVNAFIVAGVETVIGTLTTVPDDTASIFTKYFYDKLIRSSTTQAACSDDSWVCPASSSLVKKNKEILFLLPSVILHYVCTNN